MASSNVQDEDIITNTVIEYGTKLKQSIVSRGKLTDLGMIVFITLVILILVIPIILSVKMIQEKFSKEVGFSLMIPSLMVVLIMILSYRTTESQLSMELDVTCVEGEDIEMLTTNKIYITQFLVLQFLKTYAKFIIYALVAYFFFMVMYVLLCAGDSGQFYALGEKTTMNNFWKLPIKAVEFIGKNVYESLFLLITGGKSKMYTLYRNLTPADMLSFFNIFGESKTPFFIHLTVFLTGLIACVLIGCLYVKPIDKNKKPCKGTFATDAMESFKLEFINGYFIIISIVVFLYLAYSLTMIAKFG